MSDSNPIKLFNQYRNNDIDKEELKEQILKWNSMEQLSLYNQIICDNLKVKRVVLIEERKE